jgi:hypothetical protein
MKPKYGKVKGGKEILSWKAEIKDENKITMKDLILSDTFDAVSQARIQLNES